MGKLSDATTDKRGSAALAGLMLVVLCSTAAIVATYPNLSHTVDEGTHVTAGLRVLQHGNYPRRIESPPLARVVLAVIPYLAGARLASPGRVSSQDVFYRTPQHIRHVTEARVANLLFFWAAVALTWRLAGGRADPWVALLAGSAVATVPPLVAHAGLATTDVALVAVFLLVLLALRRVLAHPSMSSACALGVAVGLAIATKFSIFVLLPPVVAMTVAASCWDRRAQWTSAIRSREVWVRLSAMTVIAALVVWGIYGFRIGRLEDLPVGRTALGHQPPDSWLTALGTWRIPAHELVGGLISLGGHTIQGHRATLFDEFSQHGFLLFHPVVFLTKTPEPFLLFAAAGLLALTRRREHPEWRWFSGLALGAAGLMAVAMMSSINNGVRHILVLYPLLALASSFGLVRWAERARHARSWLAGAAACIALQLGVLASSVPDQIAYFNVFAGSDPAYISSDSDLDWGQHAIYLERYFAAHPVPELYVQLNGHTRTCELELPPLKALPLHPVSGWIAVSERIYRLNRGGIRSDPCSGNTITAPPGWLNWLKAYEPVAIIGKTVRLYYVPPAGPSSMRTPAARSHL